MSSSDDMFLSPMYLFSVDLATTTHTTLAVTRGQEETQPGHAHARRCPVDGQTEVFEDLLVWVSMLDNIR